MAKNAKKVSAPKPAKVAKPKKETGVILAKAQLKFVSFSFGAVIPTQSFGNVQPQIVVEAPTYEEARDFAIPKIEELYAKYAQIKPEFLGKIEVEEKVVAPAPKPAPAAPTATVGPHSTVGGGSATAAPVAPQTATPAAPQTPKSEHALKAEKMIALAATKEAAELIQDKIEKSVKILPEEKPALIVAVLEKRNSFGKPK